MAIYTFTGDFAEDLKNFPTPDIPEDAVFKTGFTGGARNQKGEANSFYGRKHTNPEKCASYGMLDKTHSEETKKKMSETHMGKPGTNNGRKFGPRTEEQKKRISEATKLGMKNAKKAIMPKKTCPHCGLTGSANNITRYHFDNCKTLYK